jgi:UDP-N-acetylglucosamine--N-acetylmuramyl-(pentapeptide) pyrophosphoryl-undecaprenol N-acetylglucosamine transferase
MTDVLIAGGGTGGHLFPGIALAQEVCRRDPKARVLFVGTARGIETRAVPEAGFDLALVPVTGLRRVGIGGLIAGLARLPWAVVRAFDVVRRFGPEVAVGVGGYAAGPAIFAARLLGVPCVVMEQNTVPGLTNRILGKLARRVFAGLPTRGFAPGKVKVLGNPVREELAEVRDQSYEPGQPPRLLVFGGSQGARALNEAMMAAAPELAGRGWSILHQTGEADCERVRAAYGAAGLDADVRPFVFDMATAYRDADLVLCRAGAMTIAELTVCGRPAVLVPYAFAVDDHQSKNARTLEDAGAAVLFPQSSLTPEGLVELLTGLLGAPERLREMAARSRAAGKPDAVSDIADALEQEVRRV